MKVQPYLFFDGRCEEALSFYRKAAGAEIEQMMRYKENPEGVPTHLPPGSGEKVMHVNFRMGDTQLFASDGMCGGAGPQPFSGFSLTISARNVAEADRLFAALGEGGQVQMPLTETFFSPRVGMVADKFGVSWMIIVEK